jgi:uncharacterized damage-inducible protein DinB
MAAQPQPLTKPLVTEDFALTFRDITVGTLEHEFKISKRVIARIPEDKKAYRPHPISRSAWELACHLAVSDVWFLEGIAARNFAWDAEAKEEVAPTLAELNEWYDKNFKAAIAKIRGMSAEELVQPVDFFGVMNLPVVLYLQTAISHAIHHRGQLSTYLRPMGAKVPDIGGGSYDEPFKGA